MPAKVQARAPALYRVAIVGASSTGKSTLAQALAAHHQTLWVPEYLREFVDTLQRTPQEHEQISIATTQVRRESLMASELEQVSLRLPGVVSQFLFCDTTPLMTAIYSQIYFGAVDAELAQLTRSHRYDFTLVTAPELGWTPDGLQRDSTVSMQHLHGAVIAMLADLQTPYQLISGSVEQRLRQALDYLADAVKA
jgi:nicotinamide riboside kinase